MDQLRGLRPRVRVLKPSGCLLFAFMNWWVQKRTMVASGCVTGLGQGKHIGGKAGKRAIDHIMENSWLRDL